MKWTEIEICKLTDLIHQGVRHDEISKIMGRTTKSINIKCGRLNLNTIYTKDFTCKGCGLNFTDYIKTERIFCSSSCNAKYNNTFRILTEETKSRISESMKGKRMSEETKLKISGVNNNRYKHGLSKRTEFYNGKRKCKKCLKFNIEKSKKIMCEKCRYEYLEIYRPSCNFDFDINKFKDEFDFSLVSKFGWYSPVNKMNNLNGVSRDHLYSIKDGFLNKVSTDIMRHPANCQLLIHSDNSSKGVNSKITIEELMNRIKKWDEKYC